MNKDQSLPEEIKDFFKIDEYQKQIKRFIENQRSHAASQIKISPAKWK